MQKSFTLSSNVVLLFKQWDIHKTGIFIAALIGVFAFTFVYELARYYHSRFGRCRTKRRPSVNESKRYGTFDHRSQDDEDSRLSILCSVCKVILFTWSYVFKSLSFVILVAANYFIMLAVMTFNAWLLVAVCFASGLAYFLLSQEQSFKRDLKDDRSCLLHRDNHQEL